MKPIYLYRNSDETPLGAVRVDRFPDFALPQRTIGLHTHNFYGNVKVEASIVLQPASDADWVSIWSEDFPVRTEDMSSIQNRVKNVVGNFIWMRVTVTAITGHVDRVMVI